MTTEEVTAWFEDELSWYKKRTTSKTKRIIAYEMALEALIRLERNIPLDDFLKTIERRPVLEAYIVHLKYRYEHEMNFTYSVEVLELENGGFFWLNDWDEGQTEVYVVNAVPLAEVFEYIANDRALLKILKEGKQ